MLSDSQVRHAAVDDAVGGFDACPQVSHVVFRYVAGLQVPEKMRPRGGGPHDSCGGGVSVVGAACSGACMQWRLPPPPWGLNLLNINYPEHHHPLLYRDV